MNRALISIATASLLLMGCSSDGKNLSTKKSSTLSEAAVISEWKGKTGQDLISKYGQPDIVIDTTLLGRPPSEGYVYDESRLADNSNCVNVYVMGTSNKVIYDYFCQ